MEEHSDSEDSLELAAKTWNRVIDAASKTGYREGIEEGSQAVLQEDFDIGYEEGFRAAFELGKYKGLSAALSKDLQHPKNIVEILDKTRRGACHICSLESESQDSDLSSSDVLDNHRKHVELTLRTVQEYFDPLLRESDIEASRLK